MRGYCETADDVARYLGLHADTVRKHYREFCGVKVGRLYRFNLACLDRLLSQGALPKQVMAKSVVKASAPADDRHDLLA